MEPNTISHKWYQQVWNDGNESAIDGLLSPDFVAHGLSDEVRAKGISGFKDFYRQFREEFSNVQITVEDVICQGDKEAARTSVTAIHNPTGKEVTFTGMTMSIIRDGQMAEAWNNFDFLIMNQRLGLKMVPSDMEKPAENQPSCE